VEAWLLAIVLLVGLVVMTGLAAGGRRTVTRVRAAAGAAPGADPVGAVATILQHNNRLEDELAADRHDHDLLIDSLAQGVVSVDRALRIVGANSAAHGFLGRPQGALIGRSLIEAFLDVQVEAIARGGRRRAAPGKGSRTCPSTVASTRSRRTSKTTSRNS
jgi:PAS domain-containing protein